jgi:uncharacterized protein YndB with AHSA1/START domain
MIQPSVPRAIADLSGGLILATVDIEAPPERVFKALSSDDIVQWWGDSSLYHTTAWSADVRVGGSWRAEGRAADGSPYSVSGEYLAVEPPTRLVQTWMPDWAPGPATRVSYILQALGAGTRVTVRHEGFDDRAACESHTAGWERVLQWLATYCRAGVGAGHPAAPAGPVSP